MLILADRSTAHSLNRAHVDSAQGRQQQIEEGKLGPLSGGGLWWAEGGSWVVGIPRSNC